MLKRLLILALPLSILAGGAQAAEKPGETSGEKSKEVGQYLDLQPVALPIVVKGQLVNYVFVYVRINLARSADVTKIRDKEPDFRDALVRDGHRSPFVLPHDWEKVDEAKLAAAMTRDAASIVGPGVVSSVVVTSQVPRKHVSAPRT